MLPQRDNEAVFRSSCPSSGVTDSELKRGETFSLFHLQRVQCTAPIKRGVSPSPSPFPSQHTLARSFGRSFSPARFKLKRLPRSRRHDVMGEGGGMDGRQADRTRTHADALRRN